MAFEFRIVPRRIEAVRANGSGNVCGGRPLFAIHWMRTPLSLAILVEQELLTQKGRFPALLLGVALAREIASRGSGGFSPLAPGSFLTARFSPETHACRGSVHS